MENVKKIEQLISNGNKLKRSFDKYIELTKHPSCDKYGFAFNKDSRFAACKPLHLSLDNWIGYFADSGCSTFLSLDSEVFNKHLLASIQSRFKEILNDTADRILTEATTLKEEAKKELTDKLAAIENLQNPQPNESN